jgi:CRP/FNR family transcriptional regulator
LAEASTLRHLQPGEILVRAGSPETAIVHLVEGKLAIYRSNQRRKTTLLLGVIAAPAIVGDAEAAAKTPWMCSVRAEEEATCLMIPNDAFFNAVKSNIEVAFRMYLDASVRHLLANHTAQSVALYDIETRLLRVLLDYARRYGRIEQDRAIVGRKMSQVELAAALGVATKTVARALKPLTAQGIVSEDEEGAMIVQGLSALRADLPPDLFGLSSRMGEAAAPLVSRWQSSLDE